MRYGYLPTTDRRLLQWAGHFNELIQIDPARYGLSPERSAAFDAIYQTFASALAACEPAIRSRSATSVKNTARANLKANVGTLVSLIRGAAGVSDAQKIALGIGVRARPTRIDAPDRAPLLTVRSVRATTATVVLTDPTSSRRGKPDGAAGATLFVYVGDEPPTNLSGWRYYGQTGRTTIDITFESSLPPGTRVWFTALWFSARKETSPLSPPIHTHLQGGGVQVSKAMVRALAA
ncbi:MAG: hypothetical protein QM770_21725 [Tepidisphaeraceae bacterium]